MRIKSFSEIVSIVLIVLVSTYCCTISSFQNFIPSTIKQFFLIIIPVGIIFILMLINIAQNGFDKVISPGKIIVLLIIIVLFVWDNYTLNDTGLLGMYGLLMPLLIYLVWFEDNSCLYYFVYIVAFFGFVYAIFTFVCEINTGFYYDYVYPTLRELYPDVTYTPSPQAGFTAHYSINGMYLTNGLFAFIALICGRKRFRILHFISSFLILIAILICGKRGLLLCLILSIYISYFVFSKKNISSKLFKIIFISFIAFVSIWILSYFIPDIWNAINRMLEMIDKDDISTGRFEMWNQALSYFDKYPFLGYGWRWFYYNAGGGLDVHNCYLQLLLEVGIIGSIPFFCFFAYNLYQTIRMVKNGNLYDVGIKGLLLFSIMYQVFFLGYIFEGTGLFNVSVFLIYILSCLVPMQIKSKMMTYSKKVLVEDNLYAGNKF